MNAQADAIADADAHLNNAGLPTYTELMAAAQVLIDSVRQGPDQVIGYDRNGANQKAFEHGWNAKADKVWNASHVLRRLATEAA